MRTVFRASLCRTGAHGGAVWLLDQALVFKTQKLTLPENLKNFRIPYGDITAVRPCRALFFPAVAIERTGDTPVKLIVWRRRHFLRLLSGRCKIE